MDKVQFNNEVVSMRKVVKRVKVQVAKNLTRQIKQLRNKKGKPEEVEKNKRRCDRLVEVVQALKLWRPDDVTYTALRKSPTATETAETAREKSLFRLINHPIFVKRLATFKDLVTPDLLRTRRHNKKVKKVSKAHASIEDGKSTSMVGKDDREQDAVQGGTKSLESDDDDSGNDNDDSESDDDGASFFLQSQKNKSRGLLTNTKDSSVSEKNVIDMESNEMAGEEDMAVMSSSEAESDVHEEGDVKEKGEDKEGTSIPKVDLPNQTKQYRKSKHIPGISAPIGTKNPEIKDSSKHKKERGGSNIAQHFPKQSQKRKPVKQHQTSVNGSQGRGRNSSQSSRERTKSHPTSNRYKEPTSKNSRQAKTQTAHTEKDNGEKMHPSWLAKKNQRAGEKPVNFAGKKTTFSDD